MRLSLFKKLMLTMLVVGSAGGIVGAGTFASFNASVTNSGNTFASGTVTLQTTQASGKTCTTSQAGGSNVSVSTGCTTSLFATATNVAAGDTYYGHIQLLNQGSIATTVAASVSDANASNPLTNETSGVGPVNAGSGSSSDLTPNLGVLVFECTNAGADADCAGTTAASVVLKLIYGTCAGSVTSITLGHNFPVVTTDFVPGTSNNNVTVGGTSCVAGNDSVGGPTYPLSFNVANTGLNETSLAATSGAASLAVLVYLPTPAGNTLQGASANLSFAWTATQIAGTSH